MTPTPEFDRRSLLLSAVLAVVLVLLTGAMAVYVLSDRDLRAALNFGAVAADIDEIYPGHVDRDQLIRSAREAMFEKLDRFSGYMDSQQFAQMNEEFSGGYGGIGISVLRHDRGLLIMSVREGSPADKVGLLTGDVIISADSINLAGLSTAEASDHLRGIEGTKVRLGIFRPATSDTISVELTRARIPLLHVPYAGLTPDSMLYIRVLDFESGASRDISDALDTLLLDGKTKPRGVIIDLRGNPGGLLTEAYRTASLFLDRGKFIVGTDGRSRWNEEQHFSTGSDLTGGLPMAILVDRGSASASEIVAGSLHQLGRAILVGDTTFGKGLVQGITQLSDGSALRLTISRYYLEGGLYLNRFDSTLSDTGSGLTPDYPVKFIEREEFPRRLENSLLLQEFANLHQDEIIAASQNLALPGTWVDRFRKFARDSGFVFQSIQTQSAQMLVELAVIEQSSKPVLDAAVDILNKAQQDDRDQFLQYGDFIRTRLKQLAWERKFGTYREYADVIVRERPDIQYAAELLKQGKQPKPAIEPGT